MKAPPNQIKRTARRRSDYADAQHGWCHDDRGLPGVEKVHFRVERHGKPGCRDEFRTAAINDASQIALPITEPLAPKNADRRITGWLSPQIPVLLVSS